MSKPTHQSKAKGDDDEETAEEEEEEESNEELNKMSLCMTKI